ncbi:hypothetical protein [Frankia gtarii]|uniref:hypothetical protein n=1 Tax=Frankia gtarii TaxID=2950102 RepID=UPI0021C02C2B|nr:hypothetical protein [Frankia gtarii]
MLAAFWAAVGGKLADRWAAVAVPALVFWLAAGGAWTLHRGGVHTLTDHSTWLAQQSAAGQIVILTAALLTVGLSATAVNRAATPALRLIEGYWPRWADPLRHRLAGWLADRAAAEAPVWQAAYSRVHGQADPVGRDLTRYNRLERRRRRRPAATGHFLPTPIGNILRAAERRPIDKYGLDTVILWPRLWPALPDAVRRDLLAARGALDAAVTTAIWGLLFCAFAPVTLLAVPAGLAVATVAIVLAIPGRAQIFGDLIEAAYDQHRTVLYAQLRWPLPANPAEERAAGQALTAYLWRGSDANTPTFTPFQP